MRAGGGVAPVAHSLGGVARDVLHVEEVFPRLHLVEVEFQSEVIGKVHEVLGNDGLTAEGLVVGGVPLVQGHADGADVVVPAGGGQGDAREGNGGVELQSRALVDLLSAAGGGLVAEGGALVTASRGERHAYGCDLHSVQIGTVTAHGDTDGMLSFRKSESRLGGVHPVAPVHTLDGVLQVDGLAAVHAHRVGARGLHPAEGEAEVVVSRRLGMDLELEPVPVADTVEVGGAEVLFQVEVAAKGGTLVGIGVDLTEDDLCDLALRHGGGLRRRDGEDTESGHHHQAGQYRRTDALEQLHRGSFLRALANFTTARTHNRFIMVIIPYSIPFVNRIEKNFGNFSGGATGCDSLLGRMCV